MPQSNRQPRPTITAAHLVALAFVVFVLGIVTVRDFLKRGSTTPISTGNIAGKNTAVQKRDRQAIIQVNDFSINAEIADTDIARARGLSGRQPLAENTGMLFVFPKETIQYFWMKEMLFPLDIIWINNNEVIDIDQNVPVPEPGTPDDRLPKYSPKKAVNYVLEVNAGFVDENKIKVGDKVNIRL